MITKSIQEKIEPFAEHGSFPFCRTSYGLWVGCCRRRRTGKGISIGNVASNSFVDLSSLYIQLLLRRSMTNRSVALARSE